MRNCAHPRSLRRTFCRTRVKCRRSFITRFSNRSARRRSLAKCPYPKWSRTDSMSRGYRSLKPHAPESSRSRRRDLAVLCTGSSRRLLSSACRSFIFSFMTMIDGESAAAPRRLYVSDSRKLHSLHDSIRARYPRILWIETPLCLVVFPIFIRVQLLYFYSCKLI